MKLLLAAVFALLVVGCGGPMTDDELERGIDSLGAVAAEGRIVALDVAEDRTKVTFTRVHSRALEDEAEHEAEKLADAESGQSNGAVKADAVQLARDIADKLGELQVFPRDRERARRLARELDELASRAQALGTEL